MKLKQGGDRKAMEREGLGSMGKAVSHLEWFEWPVAR
jgi:hypothetical protein